MIKKLIVRLRMWYADIPMPNDLLNSSNTEQFTKKAEEDYSGGKAYTEFLKFFYKGGKK